MDQHLAQSRLKRTDLIRQKLRLIIDSRKQGRCAKRKISEIRSPRAEKPLEAGASCSARRSVAGAAFFESAARLQQHAACSSWTQYDSRWRCEHGCTAHHFLRSSTAADARGEEGPGVAVGKLAGLDGLGFHACVCRLLTGGLELMTGSGCSSRVAGFYCCCFCCCCWGCWLVMPRRGVAAPHVVLLRLPASPKGVSDSYGRAF